MGDQSKLTEGRQKKKLIVQDTMTATRNTGRSTFSSNKCCGSFLRGYEGVHHDIVAEASGHDEEMEDLVGTEVLVAGVEDRKLQGVDNAAHGIDDASGEEPAKGCRA